MFTFAEAIRHNPPCCVVEILVKGFERRYVPTLPCSKHFFQDDQFWKEFKKPCSVGTTNEGVLNLKLQLNFHFTNTAVTKCHSNMSGRAFLRTAVDDYLTRGCRGKSVDGCCRGLCLHGSDLSATISRTRELELMLWDFWLWKCPLNQEQNIPQCLRSISVIRFHIR